MKPNKLYSFLSQIKHFQSIVTQSTLLLFFKQKYLLEIDSILPYNCILKLFYYKEKEDGP